MHTIKTMAGIVLLLVTTTHLLGVPEQRVVREQKIVVHREHHEEQNQEPHEEGVASRVQTNVLKPIKEHVIQPTRHALQTAGRKLHDAGEQVSGYIKGKTAEHAASDVIHRTEGHVVHVGHEVAEAAQSVGKATGRGFMHVLRPTLKAVQAGSAELHEILQHVFAASIIFAPLHLVPGLVKEDHKQQFINFTTATALVLIGSTIANTLTTQLIAEVQ